MMRQTVRVTSAHIKHVPAIADILNRFAGRGEILPRPIEEVYQSIREWVVAVDGDAVVGCGSLVVLWNDLAEIRSLIVDPDYQGEGIGRQMVEMLLEESTRLDIPKVFALTRKPGFFHSVGFNQVPRASLPRKIWKDCIHCTMFLACDEVAMLQEIEVSNPLEPCDSLPLMAGLATA
jgi:amino-acid N-acetyltransferase